MSSLDLSDEHISMAYDALAQNNPLRWFLVTYSNKPNQLILCASGTGDIEDLRSHLTPGNVHYGLFREQSLHVALSYIPDAVSGVKRARALVHARVVSSKFKAHQVLNVSNPDQITIDALRSALRLPPRNSQRSALLGLGAPPRSFSISRKPTSDMHSASLSTASSPTDSDTLQAHPRSTSSPFNLSSGVQASAGPTGVLPVHPEESMSDTVLSTPSNTQGQAYSHLANITTADRADSPPIPGPVVSPALHSAFSAPSSSGSGLTDDQHMPPSPLQASWLAKQESPLPPPPPKDPEPESVPDEQRGVDHGPDSSDERPTSLHMGSIPDSQSVASRDSLLATPPSPSRSPPHPAPGLSPRSPEQRADHPVDGLPESSLSSPFSQQLDPPPRTGTQKEAFRQRSNQTVQIDDQNNPSQREDSPDLHVPQRTRSRFQARGVVAAADEEEERRLAVLDEERRRRAVERAKREKEDREEEEARQREFEERKERDKKRRWELARKAEERRIEQQRRQEEDERRRKEETARKEEEVRERRSHIERRFEKQKGLDLLSGFITLESSSSWKRRYFRLSTEDWVFFKSDKEITHPVHAIELRHVRGLREWNEGYEELEAIPHSFAVELEDARRCLFFADSAEDKEVLLGLLNQASGQ